jgi:hypothetical protein
MLAKKRTKGKVYLSYPLSSIVVYHSVTMLHFLLGGSGIILGSNFSGPGYLFGFLYLLFAFVQMYVIMPLTVCPNCIYCQVKHSCCISGLNVISQKMSKAGNLKDFPKRAKGLFCHNHLYMAALFVPILAMIPALILNFSLLLLTLFLAVVGLLWYRFLVVFPKIACVHCSAKYICPNAKAMGLH